MKVPAKPLPVWRVTLRMETPLSVVGPEETWGLTVRAETTFFDFLTAPPEPGAVHDAEIEANPAVPDVSALLVTSPAALTGATLVLLLDQVADEVTSCVDPSEY